MPNFAEDREELYSKCKLARWLNTSALGMGTLKIWTTCSAGKSHNCVSEVNRMTLVDNQVHTFK